MLEQLFNDLKLDDGNKITLGCRSMIWSYFSKRYEVLEAMEFSNGSFVVGKFVDPFDALNFLMNPFQK